jgi:hypothetical protein
MLTRCPAVFQSVVLQTGHITGSSSFQCWLRQMDWRQKLPDQMTDEELIAIANGGNGVTQAG